MRIKRRCYDQFIETIESEMLNLITIEPILKKYNDGFEISSRQEAFNKKIKKELFNIVFNERLFAYLIYQTEKILKPDRRRNGSRNKLSLLLQQFELQQKLEMSRKTENEPKRRRFSKNEPEEQRKLKARLKRKMKAVRNISQLNTKPTYSRRFTSMSGHSRDADMRHKAAMDLIAVQEAPASIEEKTAESDLSVEDPNRNTGYMTLKGSQRGDGGSEQEGQISRISSSVRDKGKGNIGSPLVKNVTLNDQSLLQGSRLGSRKGSRMGSRRSSRRGSILSGVKASYPNSPKDSSVEKTTPRVQAVQSAILDFSTLSSRERPSLVQGAGGGRKAMTPKVGLLNNRKDEKESEMERIIRIRKKKETERLKAEAEEKHKLKLIQKLQRLSFMNGGFSKQSGDIINPFAKRIKVSYYKGQKIVSIEKSVKKPENENRDSKNKNTGEIHHKDHTKTSKNHGSTLSLVSLLKFERSRKIIRKSPLMFVVNQARFLQKNKLVLEVKKFWKYWMKQKKANKSKNKKKMRALKLDSSRSRASTFRAATDEKSSGTGFSITPANNQSFRNNQSEIKSPLKSPLKTPRTKARLMSMRIPQLSKEGQKKLSQFFDIASNNTSRSSFSKLIKKPSPPGMQRVSLMPQTSQQLYWGESSNENSPIKKKSSGRGQSFFAKNGFASKSSAKNKSKISNWNERYTTILNERKNPKKSPFMQPTPLASSPSPSPGTSSRPALMRSLSRVDPTRIKVLYQRPTPDQRDFLYLDEIPFDSGFDQGMLIKKRKSDGKPRLRRKSNVTVYLKQIQEEEERRYRKGDVFFAEFEFKFTQKEAKYLILSFFEAHRRNRILESYYMEEY